MTGVLLYLPDYLEEEWRVDWDVHTGSWDTSAPEERPAILGVLQDLSQVLCRTLDRIPDRKRILLTGMFTPAAWTPAHLKRGPPSMGCSKTSHRCFTGLRPEAGVAAVRSAA